MESMLLMCVRKVEKQLKAMDMLMWIPFIRRRKLDREEGPFRIHEQSEQSWAGSSSLDEQNAHYAYASVSWMRGLGSLPYHSVT